MSPHPSFDAFLCSRDELSERLQCIDPRAYDKTRNYLDGSVTWLSPFTTHGVISTRQIADAVMREYAPKKCYRLLFELGWREFFHRTWQLSGEEIFSDMRHAQSGVRHTDLPKALAQASTGVEVVDSCLETLKEHGVMHNHARMWTAGIVCSMAGAYWLEPARWLHYHLLDGDLASNTLSWQWVAGTFSHKQYVANQDNVNKYSKTQQSGNWLDVPYEAFDHFSPPAHLLERCEPDYQYDVPGTVITELSGDVALRSLWNLDPLWQPDIEQHIVFIDTAWHKRWPMSPKRWQFIEHWASNCGAKIYHGTLEQLQLACKNASVLRLEYPACEHWPGKVAERDWLYPMPDNEFSSFSQFFKQVKRHAGL